MGVHAMKTWSIEITGVLECDDTECRDFVDLTMEHLMDELHDRGWDQASVGGSLNGPYTVMMEVLGETGLKAAAKAVRAVREAFTIAQAQAFAQEASETHLVEWFQAEPCVA